jgi:hypothetical protein
MVAMTCLLVFLQLDFRLNPVHVLLQSKKQYIISNCEFVMAKTKESTKPTLLTCQDHSPQFLVQSPCQHHQNLPFSSVPTHL